MLQLVECEEDKVLKVTASGVLTRADHTTFLERLKSLFDRWGKMRVLCELRDFVGWQENADWDDPTFSMRYRDHLQRLALIGPTQDRRRMALMSRPFINVRFFGPAQRDEAWNWLTNGEAESYTAERIRRLAYSKWQKAGCPPGDGLAFWLEAEHDLHCPKRQPVEADLQGTGERP